MADAIKLASHPEKGWGWYAVMRHGCGYVEVWNMEKGGVRINRWSARWFVFVNDDPDPTTKLARERLRKLLRCS